MWGRLTFLQQLQMNPAEERRGGSLPWGTWWSGPAPPRSRTSADWWLTWRWAGWPWTPPGCPVFYPDRISCRQSPPEPGRSLSNAPHAAPMGGGGDISTLETLERQNISALKSPMWACLASVPYPRTNNRLLSIDFNKGTVIFFSMKRLRR